MGKRAQIRRQKQREAEKERKQAVERIRHLRQPWLTFWRRVDFWIYFACFILLAIHPVLGPLVGSTKNNGVLSSADRSATIHTSMGDIELELYGKDAPKTVDNFVKLSRGGYYNNLTFHRIIKDFMIQGGDPNGDGTGGQSAFGATFEDEINPKSLGVADDQIKQFESQGYKYNYALNSHKVDVGAIAMANSGPNTNGSQFFIVTEQPQPHLDGKHTVFGAVKKGMEVVRAIASVEVDDKDRSIDSVYISSIEIK